MQVQNCICIFFINDSRFLYEQKHVPLLLEEKARICVVAE